MKRFIIYLGLIYALFSTSIAFSAISFDAAVDSGGSGTSISHSFTIGGGSDRLLSGWTATEGQTTVTSMTYDGVAMVKIGERDQEGNLTGALFYMLETDLPTAGTYTLTANFDSSIGAAILACVSLEGVAQQAPEATLITGNDGGALVEGDITTITDNAWLVSGAGAGDGGTFTAHSGAVERTDQSQATMSGTMSTRTTTTAGLITEGFTHSDAGNFRSVLISAAFEEAGLGVPPSTTIYGVTMSGVTIN